MRTLLLGMPYEEDELFTAVTTDPTLAFSWIYAHYLIVDVHPPLYNALLWIWNHFVPYGPEKWLRLPSFLMGIGVLVEAWFLYPSYLQKKSRLIFTALFACNIYVIFYAQHARSYMGSLLLALPYTFLFLQLSRQIAKKQVISLKTWALWGGLSLALCWMHYFGALLVGMCGLFLLLNAWYTKHYFKTVLGLLLGTGLFFAPWWVPNIILLFQAKQFSGAWWGNMISWHQIPRRMLNFCFTNTAGSVLLGGCLLLGITGLVERYRQIHKIPYARELASCVFVLGVTVVIIVLISLRVFLLLPRYFMVFLPFLFLSFALVLSYASKKYRLVSWAVLYFFINNLLAFQVGHLEFKYTPKLPCRFVSQLFKRSAKGKELFVISLDAFPREAIAPMYGFYVNRVYGLNVPVTELFSLDTQTRKEVLRRQDNAVIIMPNCSPERIEKVMKTWGVTIGVQSHISRMCILTIFEE